MQKKSEKGIESYYWVDQRAAKYSENLSKKYLSYK